MPKIKDILGDEFAILQGQGKSDKEIIAIAKDRLKNPPQILETPQVVAAPKENVPAWYKGESDSGIANLGGDILRGAGKTGLNYMNLLQGGDEETTKLLQKLDKITEDHKSKGRTPEREKEVEELNKKYSDAKGFGDKFSAGFDTVIDTLANPSEWQIGEFIGENLDPINVLPAGKGILAGATIGGITNGAQAAAFAAPRSDKSSLDVAVEAALGATAGVALGGVTGGLTKKAPLHNRSESNYDAAMNDLGINEAVEGEVVRAANVDENGMIINPFKEGVDPVTFEAEIVKKKSYALFAELINKEEASVKNVDAVVKSIGDEMQAAGATPEMIEMRVAEELKPSAESLAISHVLNDGEPLTPRLSGLNMQQAIVNSIENPTKTTAQFYESMLVHGATEEHALAATKAYDTKEIAHYSTYAHDKLAANMDQIVDVESVKLDAEDMVAQQLVLHSREDLMPAARHELMQGEHGKLFTEFKGNYKGALDALIRNREGDALGALYHKDIGAIDLVWGKEGTAKSDGSGLSKLLKYHPEVVENLDSIVANMEVTKRTKNRVQLESADHKAGVRLDWDKQYKAWLLTAFEKEEALAHSRTDSVSHHATELTTSAGAYGKSITQNTKDSNNIANIYQKDIQKIEIDDTVDNSYALAHDALPIEETRTATQQSALFGDEQQLFDVPGDTRLKTPKWAEKLVNGTTRYEDIVRDVTNAKNGEKPTPLAKRAQAAMASEELKALSAHERYDEVLNFTRDLEAKDGVSPQRLDSSRSVSTVDNVDGYHTTVEGATYSKNYAHDFTLTKARVNRIENNRATLQDIQSLKADLDMIENNPTYALPTEAELKASYEAQSLNPTLIFDVAEFEKLQQRFDPETYAEARELFGETTKEEILNDTNYTRDLARDSSISNAQDGNNARVNADARGSNDSGIEHSQRADGADGLSKQGDSSTSNDPADLFGEPGDTELHTQNRADTVDGSTAGDSELARSGGVDGDGIQSDSAAEAATITDTKPQQEQSGNAGLESGDRDLSQRIAAQKEAQLTPIKINDPQNIHDTLPILLKAQVEDVVKAESRFLGSDERGMLFTNGTGTGKTFTGLGIAKRFERMGKKDIVVLVPSEAKAIDWIDDAKLVNLNMRKLKSIKDSGEGDIIVTTYENFRDNAGLRARSIDMLIADESHKIMGNKDGKHTANLDALREITGYYQNAKSRARSHFADQRAALDKRIEKVGGRYEEAAAPYIQELKELDDQAQLMAREINSKTKTVFLSASPFASHKSLRYADDYLFNFESNKWSDPEYNGAYNSGSAEDGFFMSNFGYKMRYNKLTRPDAEVNVDMMERAYAEKLRESGAMSGRILDVDKDYQRAFVLVDSEIGKKIDAGFERLNDDKDLGALRGVMRASYMDTVSLMESIKAQEAISRIKGHLEADRKVVVYHTFVDVHPSHPFKLDKYIDDAVAKAAKGEYDNSNELRTKLDAEYEQFKSKYSDLYNMDLGELASPTDTISKAFGDDVVMFNRLAGSKKHANKNMFNDNEVDIIMVNESGKEGISLHDKLGDKQRVIVNLTLPIKPIDMIQVEGRIYRTGQKSDAIFEYLTLHTNFEKRYFGSSINERVATVENLAMGEQSRSLRSSIKEGYLSADVIEAQALDGKGGKAFDMRAEGDKVTGDSFNFAKTLYFGKSKGRQNHRGADFFATPDPLGFKMVEWADIKANDKVLEPSAGVGAIGKWFPADSVNHFVEQSSDLFSDLGIAVQGKVQHMDFMDLDLHNKYDAIVMNPPFGRASVTAIQHLQKAMSHTNKGGRVVMLAPNNMMDKASFKKMLDDKAFSGWVLQDEIKLPDVTFARAGTKVWTSVYVFNKTGAKDMLNISNRYTNDIQADSINSLFDEIEGLEVDRREVPRAPGEVDAEISAVMSDMPIEIGVFKHTKTGEDMTVVKLGDHLSREQYQAFKGEIKEYTGYWSRHAKGFLFKDEAKAQRFKDGVSDGSVKVNAMFVPYAEKLTDVMMNFDKYADKAYDSVSDFVRDVDADGIPKPVREAKNMPHAMANNVFGWLRDNMVLGGGRANHYLNVLRDYTNTKGEIAGDALKMREALKHLNKEDSQDLVRALGGDLPVKELDVKMLPIYEKFRKLIDQQTEELIAAGALDEKYAKEDYVKRYYFEHIAREKSFVNMKGSEANSAKFARADIDLDERIELGQVEDASYVVAKTIMEQRDQLNRAKLFNKIADEIGSDEAIDGYVKVPDVKLGIINKWGALNGKYVPKQVFDDLKGSAKMFDDLTGIEQFVAAWMSGMQHIKTNMTVKNPGTHLYNVLSNGYIAYLDGHMSQLGRVLKDRNLYKQLHDEANSFGLDSMLDDLEGVSFKSESNDGILTSLLKNAYMAEGTKVGNAMRKAYAHEDAAFKIAAYLKRKEKLQLDKFLAEHEDIKLEFEGGFINEMLIANRYKKDIQKIDLSREEMRAAFEGVDEVYVNYSTPLPAGVKNLDRSGLFPFMHYTWKATPIFLKQMMKHPYKVAMFHVAAGSWGASKILGEQDDRDKVTPEYMNDGFNMLGLDNYKELDEGEYLNIGRSVPGMRFMNKSPISVFLGLDGGILANIFGISILGMDNKGYSVDGGKYDSNGVKLAKRASALAEQTMPSLFPALPLVVRPKLDSKGKEVKGTTEVVAFGGRYFQKAYDAAAGKKDKKGNPLEVADVAKQAAGMKLQKVDKLPHAQKSVNAARKKFVRDFNKAKSSKERADAKRSYMDEIKEVAAQLPKGDAGKLKINKKLPNAGRGNSNRFVSKTKMVKLD